MTYEKDRIEANASTVAIADTASQQRFAAVNRRARALGVRSSAPAMILDL